MGPLEASLAAGLTTLSLAIAKEALIDPVYSSADVVAGAVGAAAGMATLLVTPLIKQSAYSFEVEAGLTLFSPVSLPPSGVPPPVSLFAMAHTNFWFWRAVAFQITSGSLTSSQYFSSDPRRYVFGAGALMSLYPFLGQGPVKGDPAVSVRAGLSYLSLFFAGPDESTEFISSGNTVAASLGFRLALGKNRGFHLLLQNHLLPFAGALMFGSGLQLGLAL